MKTAYIKPELKTQKIGLVGVICASAKDLSFGSSEKSAVGDWADSRAWGGTLMEEEESPAEDNEDW